MKFYLKYFENAADDNVNYFENNLNKLTDDELLKLVTFKDSNGRNILHFSCLNGSLRVIQFILKIYSNYKLNINELTNDGYNYVNLLLLQGYNKNTLNVTQSKLKIKDILLFLINNKFNYDNDIIFDNLKINNIFLCLFNDIPDCGEILFELNKEVIFEQDQESRYFIEYSFMEYLEESKINYNISLFEYIIDSCFSNTTQSLNNLSKSRNMEESIETIKDDKNISLIRLEDTRTNYNINNKKLSFKLSFLIELSTNYHTIENLSIITIRKSEEINNNKDLIKLELLLLLSVVVNRFDVFKFLIINYSLSPFNYFKDKFSAMSLIAKYNRVDFLKFIIESKFKIGNKECLISELLNLKNKYCNNCLHEACYYNSIDIIKILLNYDIDLLCLNYKGVDPLSFIKDENCKTVLKGYKANHNKDILISNFSNPICQNYFEKLYISYKYCIITKDEGSLEDNIVYSQLNMIVDNYKDIGSFKFKVIKDSGDNGLYYFFIKIDDKLLHYYCQKNKVKLFNNTNKKIEIFNINNINNYEPISDSNIIKIILQIINSEFDLEYYKQNKYILNHFSLHNFIKLNKIKENYFESKIDLLIKFAFPYLKNKKSNKNNSFLISISTYFGSKYAFYILLLFYFINMLLLLIIFVVIFYVVYYLFEFKRVSYLNIVFYFITSIWSIIFNKYWIIIQNNFIYYLKSVTHVNASLNPSYNGYLTYSKSDNKIVKENKIGTIKRRLISEMPIIFISLLLIFLVYNFNKIVMSYYLVYINRLDLHWVTYKILIYLLGIFFANISRTAFKLYTAICTNVIEHWENHKLSFEKEKSLISKSFYFKLIIFYINPLDIALNKHIFLPDIFISMMIFNNLLFMYFNIISPYLSYKSNLVSYRNKFIELYNFQKIKVKEENQITKTNMFNEDIIKHIYNFEKEFAYKRIADENNIKIDSLPINGFILEIIVQFGFISIFSFIYPFAVIISLLINILFLNTVIMFLFNCIKKGNIINIKDISMFNGFFNFICFGSIILASFIIYYGNRKIGDIFEVYKNKQIEIIIIVVIEHLFFFIKIIIDGLLSKGDNKIKKII